MIQPTWRIALAIAPCPRACSMSAASRRSRGSRFWLSLPLRQQARSQWRRAAHLQNYWYSMPFIAQMVLDFQRRASKGKGLTQATTQRCQGHGLASRLLSGMLGALRLSCNASAMLILLVTY